MSRKRKSSKSNESQRSSEENEGELSLRRATPQPHQPDASPIPSPSPSPKVHLAADSSALASLTRRLRESVQLDPSLPHKRAQTISLRSALKTTLISLSILWAACYVLPLFFCHPPDIFNLHQPDPSSPSALLHALAHSGASVKHFLHLSPLAYLLPFSWTQTSSPPSSTSGPLAQNHSVPICPSPSSLPLPACNTLCASSLFITSNTSRLVSQSVSAVRSVFASIFSPLAHSLQWLVQTVSRTTANIPPYHSHTIPSDPSLPSLSTSSSLSTSFLVPPWFIVRVWEPLVVGLYRLSLSLMDPRRRVSMIGTSHSDTAIQMTVCRLHLPDIIHHETGGDRGKGVSLEKLAERSCSVPPLLDRLLRHAEVLGLFERDHKGLWKLTDMSDYLRASHPHSFKAMALHIGSSMGLKTALYGTVQSGKPVTDMVYGRLWELMEEAQRELQMFQDQGLAEGKWGLFNPVKCAPIDFTPHHTSAVDRAKEVAYNSRHLLNPQNALQVASEARVPLPFEVPRHNTGLVTNLAVPLIPSSSSSSLSPTRPDLVKPLKEAAVPRTDEHGVPLMHWAKDFNEAMTSGSVAYGASVAQDADLDGVDLVLDISGGRGELVRQILEARSGVKTGVVFDLLNVYNDQVTRQSIERDMHRTVERRQHQQCVVSTVSHKPNTYMSFDSHTAGLTSSPSLRTWTSQNLGKYCVAETPLCPDIHTVTGDFFKPETVPSPRTFALPTLRHKLMEELTSAVQTGRELGEVVLTFRYAMTMMHIIHDWSDPDSAKILRSLHSALQRQGEKGVGDWDRLDVCGGERVEVFDCKRGQVVSVPCPQIRVGWEGKLMVIDRVIDRTDTHWMGRWETHSISSMMMTHFVHARERTMEDFRKLLAGSAFEMTRILPTRSNICVIESEALSVK